MRKASHSATRLQLERDHLELERRSQEEFMQAEFERWLTTPKGKARVLNCDQKAQLRRTQIREIFGLEPVPGCSDSSPIESKAPVNGKGSETP